LERSPLVEAAEQLARALAEIATLPGTPALRREQIKHQVGLANALMHTKGHAAPEAKAAIEQARLFIEHAETLGEPAEDPMLHFSVLYGFWVANLATFNNGDELCRLAGQFLALAEKQRATASLMIGHRLMGTSLLWTGDIAQGRVHLDRAMALYAGEHRPLAMRFGYEIGIVILCWRALALWLIGYPEVAVADADRALGNARETHQAATLMYALATITSITQCAPTARVASGGGSRLDSSRFDRVADRRLVRVTARAGAL
jgi:hypothetical protein